MITNLGEVLDLGLRVANVTSRLSGLSINSSFRWNLELSHVIAHPPPLLSGRAVVVTDQFPSSSKEFETGIEYLESEVQVVITDGLGF